ncbi:zinc finger protein 449-like [Dasypus novemcinctus]|uniref:zinc finger protein 449-like n=1 Tax=Dasypus novemcinctus TaxID=9361 RepID=UPI00265F5C10|nr:zinc finger protein 449-like [Dasypus novemcinctus]
MAVILGCAIQASLNQGSMLQEYDSDCEVFRQRFRQFQYEEAAGPREAFNKLWELCWQWLQPHIRSKEQMLELLVLEQFLSILPTEIETWVRLYSPGRREKILALIDALERELEIPKKQVGREEKPLEDLAPVGMACIPQDIHMKSLACQVMGPSQEATLAEAWFPQAWQQELNYGAAGACQHFPEPGPGYPVPKPDPRFPLEHREEPWVKALQDSKEMNHLPDSKIGFDVGRENEGDTSKQKALENMYPFTITLEDNALHGSLLQKNYEQLGYQWNNLPEVVKTDVTRLVDHQNHSLGEKYESANLNETLNFRSHKKSSPAEKPHQCSQGGKCFAQDLLTWYQRMHSGEGPHKCHECRKGFLHSSHLLRHQRVHTGERPYECSICKKRFTGWSYLMGHQGTYSEAEEYTCLECGKRFCYR